MTRNKSVRQFFGFLETLNWLQIKLLFRHPRNARSFSGHVFRNYMALAKVDRWKSITIEELLPHSQRFEITLVHLDSRGLYNSIDELAYMAMIVRALQPKAIFEIGTFWGRTALNFALNSPEDCIVYTLDLPTDEKESVIRQSNPADAGIIERSRTGIDYQDTRVAKKIRQLYGNSLRFDFSPFHGKMDVIFVDGCHHYDAVKSDTENALRMLKPGGVILWHDFANYGDYNDVTRAVLDAIPADKVWQIGNTQLAVYRDPGHSPLESNENARKIAQKKTANVGGLESRHPVVAGEGF